ncbi:hypothetical protein D9615_001393 [Tricholomella constricta]|uniref:RAVE complex protein Rav1 C-terminal domain-containing protein n=1 Tax=Tricholomella constricta TaxID=117010 RepID=A0A8H5HKF3_9AGAR|nr:hypothetical protein D9615_001393 [Tricholomella constricta]
MLQLHHAYAAYPAHIVQHLLLPQGALILYPSADVVILVNASSLSLVRVLAFSEAFPSTLNTTETIPCIAVDSGMKIVFATMNTRIAAWSLSGVQHDTWRIHSTLVLPENHTVTTLDSRSGLLAVGSQRGLSVYTLILENDLPTWSQKWTVPVPPPTCVRFAPSLMYIATLSSHDNAIRLYSTTSGRQTQIVPHPRPIMNFSWRQPQATSRDDLILYTVTNDSTIRIFLPVLDSPQNLQLHASLDLFSSFPFSIASNHLWQLPSTAFWLDREVVGNALKEILKQRIEQDDARGRRIKEILEERWDLFLRVLGDGSIVVTAVAATNPSKAIYPTTVVALDLTWPAFTSLHLPSSKSVLSPVAFFDAQTDGLRLSARMLSRVSEEEAKIVRLVRTPEGRGVGIIRSDGGGEAWRVVEQGTRLVRSGYWTSADHVVVLQGGRTFVTYSASNSMLTLHSAPPQNLSIQNIAYLFSVPSQDQDDSIIGITPDFSIVHLHAIHAPSPSLILRSQSTLPLSCRPKMILPVDPMAWGLRQPWTQPDVLLSISHAGELAFWVPEETATASWRIVPGSDGDELTIWDSHESEFATGMEFCGQHSEPIHDLDWTSTPDNQSILAVGFLHRVELLCQQRMTYFDEGPGWEKCTTIEIGSFISAHIQDSIWLANGSLLIAAGHQMFLYGAPPISSKKETLFEYAARHNGPLDDYHPQMILQCLLWDKVELVKEVIVNLSRDIASHGSNLNGIEWTSLPVERFLENDQRDSSVSTKRDIFCENNRPQWDLQNGVQRKIYTQLFHGPEQKKESDEEAFSRPLVKQLINALEACPLPHLTPNEQAHLLALVQATLEIDEQRRALDSSGLRCLISMRSFYILNRRASAPSSPESKGAHPIRSGRRGRIRYRDMIWAFHSESQDLLLNASIAACNGKLGWSDARALGLPIWLTSIETMKTQIEAIARNEYMAGENRDPTACSLYYFALGKVKLVHGLWRQAAWHKEQAVMLKFLANDFADARWRTAALKNAFALLSKRRFEYAAAFFLLGNSLKDAVNVCIKQLDDFQLAVALARVVERSNEGPVLLEILTDTVLPIAFKNGNRWLGSWAFWLLHRRDLAVRILLDIATALNIQVAEIGEPHYDDPSLALLFSQLRSKTLQAAKGTSEISGRSEFNFVLQMARVFCRMGCHVLALDLVRSWSFDRPSMVIQDDSDLVDQEKKLCPPSPTLSRRSRFDRATRRRSTILIDMHIPSLPPTRTASPERPPTGVSKITEEGEEERLQNEGDFFARKVGLGNLMKSAKQDVKVPEFDMDSFF